MLAIEGDHFVLDGKPFQIISGEMHYPRIPRDYWRDRLKKARAMGLNAITTYVFWNLHEPRPGVYDFSGQNDVAEFIRLAQKEGLYVILRPGPYICSEWDLGGLPAWLLADPNIVLRSTDSKFMTPAKRWLVRLGKEVAPLQSSRGGPIIAVQVENEYGSFDHDHEYMRQIHQALIKAGLGEALMYTADGANRLAAGTLPDLPAVVNFGPGETQEAFAALAKFRPGQPLMAGEYWAGWFDSWGLPHHTTDAAEQERDLEWMLSRGYSVSIYMFHGGTSFGFMNGANFDKTYLPQTSSYDYDAALDESGRPTKKYFAFREIIARHRPSETIPQPPQSAPVITIPSIALSQSSSLWDNLGKPAATGAIRPMEMLGLSYGYVLYRTQVDGPVKGDLKLTELHDYAIIYLDGTPIGTLDRRLGQDTLAIEVKTARAQLDILVENTGRINFGKELRGERKGITRSVTLGGRELPNWQIYALPMTDSSAIQFRQQGQAGPAFYSASFALNQTGDTFLDTRGLGKGVIWVNGHALGRYWKIGPQQTLYLPGPWLRQGKNEIIVFELEGKSDLSVEGLEHPILDQLR